MAAQERPEADDFRHTHYYDPIGWDRFDPRPHPGSGVIPPGSSVQNLGTFPGGPKAGKMTFHHVRDEAGNHQSVFRGSLTKKRPEPEEGMEKYYPGLFNDRRAEGRREKPA
jgi:hypothetical protein